jgi:hypothetical protein
MRPNGHTITIFSKSGEPTVSEDSNGIRFGQTAAAVAR